LSRFVAVVARKLWQQNASGGSPASLEPPLDDPQQVVARQAALGQLALAPPRRAEEGRLVRAPLQPGRLQVRLHLHLEVVPAGHPVPLAALLAQLEVPRPPVGA
jgi:hypothetical protein